MAMSEQEPITDGRAASRIRTECVCGFRIVGVRVTDADNRAWVRYFAVDETQSTRRGYRITMCPSCQRPLAPLSWREFLAKMSAAWGP